MVGLWKPGLSAAVGIEHNFYELSLAFLDLESRGEAS